MDEENAYRRALAGSTNPEDVPGRSTGWAWASQRPFRWLERAWAALIIVAVALLASTALSQFDVALGTMHPPGDSQYEIGNLVGPTPLGGRPWQEATSTWCEWADGQARVVNASATVGDCRGDPGVAGPRTFVFLHVIVDMIFAPCVAVLLWLLLWRTWRHYRTVIVRSEDPGYVGQLLAVALIVPALLLALDIAENLFIFFRVWAQLGEGGAGSTVASILMGLSLLKWLAVVLIAVPLAISWLTLLKYAPGRAQLRVTWRRVIALRAQVVVAAVVGVLLLLTNDLGAQIIDVLLRWGDERMQAVTAFGLLLAVTLSVIVGGRVLLASYEHSTGSNVTAVHWVTLVASGFGGFAAIVVGAIWSAQRWWLVPIGAALFAFGVLSAPSRVRAQVPRDLLAAPQESKVGSGGWVLLLLVALPGWVTGILLTRAAVILQAENRQVDSFAFLVLGLLAAGIGTSFAVLTRWRQHAADRSPGSVSKLVAGVSVAFTVAGAALWWYVGYDAIGRGAGLGALGVVLAFTFGLGWLLTWVTLAANYLPAKGALAVIGLRRVPVLALLVAFAFLAANIDQGFTFHDARLGDEPRTSHPITVDTAFTQWLTATGEGPEAIPMVFVASAGGGVRAAYWTTLTLGCLLGVAPPHEADAGECATSIERQRIFLASGISGGSLGLVATFAGDVTSASANLTKDFVAVDIAQMLFVDAPNAWIRQDGWSDRAEVLERAWEQAWQREGQANPLKAGLFEWQLAQQGKNPILILNGATVDDACRLNGSVLATAVRPGATASGATGDLSAVEPIVDESCTSLTTLTGSGARPYGTTVTDIDPTMTQSKDLHDLTCGPIGDTRYDVRLSTAALLSARFPFVSPSGGLYQCPGPGAAATSANRRTYDVDGGVLEASGARALEEVSTAIAPVVREENDRRLALGKACIEPRLIVLDNGYRSTARRPPFDRQPELFLPLQERGLAGQGATAAAQQDAAASFQRFFEGTCSVSPAPSSSVAYLYPTEHPGVRAPLGWTLSEYTQADLAHQLDSAWNKDQLELVRSWFSPP